MFASQWFWFEKICSEFNSWYSRIINNWKAILLWYLTKKQSIKKCKLYHDYGILTTENDTFSEEHGIVCTTSTFFYVPKQKNACYYNETKIMLDIDGLIKVRNSYPNKPIIGYLNVSTLQNKIISLREIIAKAASDVFCVDETKLDDSFPNSQFVLENFQFPPFYRDRN